MVRGVLGLCLVFSTLLSVAPLAHATTGINTQINYQARLLNTAGATVPDGTYNIEFKIYSGGTGCVGGGTSPCGGTAQWTEDWLNNNTQGVTVTNGYFSVLLGAGSDSVALSTLNFNQTPLWLSINIGNTNGTCASFSLCSGDGEMLPFTQFAAAPYALNAGQLGGLASSSFAQLTAANIFQPTTNITPVTIMQTSGASPTADIFDVQTANGTNILQATGPSANNSVVTLKSVGSGNALTLTGAGALSLNGNAPSTWDLNGNTLSLQTTGNGAITTGTGTFTDNGALSVAGALTVTAANNALVLSTAPTASATKSLIDLGSSIASGSTSGTFIGINAASGYGGDLVNLQVNSTSEFSVSAAGDVKQGNGVLTYNTPTAPNSYNSSSGTLTTSDLLQERLVLTQGSVGVTLTTPTASAIVAAIPHATVGDTFTFTIKNSNSTGSMTLVGGTGVTLALVNAFYASVAKGTSSIYTCRLTNVSSGTQAVTCY